MSRYSSWFCIPTCFIAKCLGLEQIDAQLHREILPLRGDTRQLTDQIAPLKRDSSNFSKPLSSNIIKPKSNGTLQGKCGIDGQKGHSRHGHISFAPHDTGPTIPYGSPAEQVRYPIPLDEWSVRQQVDLADKPHIVTEHHIRTYLDPRTGRIGVTPLPVAVKATGLAGPKLSSLSPSKRRLPHIAHCERWNTDPRFHLGLITRHRPANPTAEDYTNDDLFATLPHAYSVSIPPGIAKARFTMDSSKRLRRIRVHLLDDA